MLALRYNLPRPMKTRQHRHRERYKRIWCRFRWKRRWTSWINWQWKVKQRKGRYHCLRPPGAKIDCIFSFLLFVHAIVVILFSLDNSESQRGKRRSHLVVLNNNSSAPGQTVPVLHDRRNCYRGDNCQNSAWIQHTGIATLVSNESLASRIWEKLIHRRQI